MVLMKEVIEESEAMEFVIRVRVVQFAETLQLPQASFVHQLIVPNDLET